MLVLLVLTVADTLLEQALPRGGVDGYLKMLQGNSGFKDATLEIRKARGYTDLNGYLLALARCWGL